ncbi:MAG: N-acetylmuramoyl-L-alanine amidase, partial [Stenotrophobium sp.]
MRLVLLSVLLSFASLANAAQLQALHLSQVGANTHVVFDLQGSSTPHKIFTLANPDRVVIDIAGVDASGVALVNKTAGSGYVKNVRSA